MESQSTMMDEIKAIFNRMDDRLQRHRDDTNRRFDQMLQSIVDYQECMDAIFDKFNSDSSLVTKQSEQEQSVQERSQSEQERPVQEQISPIINKMSLQYNTKRRQQQIKPTDIEVLRGQHKPLPYKSFTRGTTIRRSNTRVFHCVRQRQKLQHQQRQFSRQHKFWMRTRTNTINVLMRNYQEIRFSNFVFDPETLSEMAQIDGREDMED
ncbi:hypothetical protein KSP39_PZI002632 [Platanthera zijinensis]|uniref:Uncharacterized protein n=1 Tax=Platanthera zijinensis TaxID=2320716 RepID=A0AAP0BZE4_9ASPA